MARKRKAVEVITVDTKIVKDLNEPPKCFGCKEEYCLEFVCGEFFCKCQKSGIK